MPEEKTSESMVAVLVAGAANLGSAAAKAVAGLLGGSAVFLDPTTGEP